MLREVVDAERVTKSDVPLRLLEGEAVGEPREEAVHHRPLFDGLIQDHLHVGSVGEGGGEGMRGELERERVREMRLMRDPFIRRRRRATTFTFTFGSLGGGR